MSRLEGVQQQYVKHIRPASREDRGEAVRPGLAWGTFLHHLGAHASPSKRKQAPVGMAGQCCRLGGQQGLCLWLEPRDGAACTRVGKVGCSQLGTIQVVPREFGGPGCTQRLEMPLMKTGNSSRGGRDSAGW